MPVPPGPLTIAHLLFLHLPSLNATHSPEGYPDLPDQILVGHHEHVAFLDGELLNVGLAGDLDLFLNICFLF